MTLLQFGALIINPDQITHIDFEHSVGASGPKIFSTVVHFVGGSTCTVRDEKFLRALDKHLKAQGTPIIDLSEQGQREVEP